MKAAAVVLTLAPWIILPLLLTEPGALRRWNTRRRRNALARQYRRGVKLTRDGGR